MITRVETSFRLDGEVALVTGGGTGLGLAIARNVAMLHGGTLELTHNRPGKIRFTLAIPFRPVVTSDPPAETSCRSREPEPVDATVLMNSEES